MKKIDLTKGSILKGLLLFSLPVFFIYFANSLYNAVDIFILSMAGADEQISAVASAFTPISFCMCLLTGAGVAGTCLIGQYVGGKSEQEKLKACKAVIMFNMCFSIGLAVIVAAASHSLIPMLNVDKSLYGPAVRYLLIQCCILPMNGIIFSVHAICKGHGKSVLPFIYSASGVFFNILFDYIFIYLLGWLSDGAAFASVLSYIVAATIILSYVFIFKFKCKNPLKGIKFDGDMFKYLGKQVIPLSLQESLVIISFITVISVINLRGIGASNVVAISDRITSLSFAPVMAFGNAVSAAVSQNLGSGQIKRTKNMVFTAIGLTAAFALVYSFPFYYFATQLSLLYTSDQEIARQSMERCFILAFDLIINIVVSPFAGLASGSGNSRWSLAIFGVGTVILRIPFTVAMGLLNYPIWVVSAAYPLSSLIGLGLALYFYFSKKWQNLKALPVYQKSDIEKDTIF